MLMALPLYACGSNGSSQLSLNHSDDAYTLRHCVFHPSVVLPPSSDIIDIVSASTHALLLVGTSTGNLLLGAGTNTLGQLGPRCALWDEVKPEGRFKLLDFVRSAEGVDGTWQPVKIAVTWTTSFVVYQRVHLGSELVEGLCAGSNASGTKAEEGIEQVLLACGSNDFGELGFTPGNGDRVSVTRPSDNATVIDIGLRKGETVEMIKGGQRHIIAVIRGNRGEQRIVGWGASRKGQLDPRSTSTSTSTPSLSKSTGVNGKGKGKGKAHPYPTISPPQRLSLAIPPGSSINDIALGASHTLALLSNGMVLAWGSDAKGQIGGISELSDIAGIAATWGGSYLLMRSGEIWSQGSDSHSQLLRQTTSGENQVRGKVQLEDGVTPRKIVAGSEHLLVLADTDGTEGLWVGGWNEHGNLGLGDQADRPVLIRLDIDGEVSKVWGGLAATWVHEIALTIGSSTVKSAELSS